MKGKFVLAMVAVLVLGLGVLAGWAGEATRPLGPQEMLVLEVKQLRQELKAVTEKLGTIEANQQALNKSVALLVASEWEYKVEAVRVGGALQEELSKLLARMGEAKWQYVGQSADGLYIFRRRKVTE